MPSLGYLHLATLPSRRTESAEATPNTEMILVSDVDLDLLNELHTYGSVRNLKDRRNDVYEVRFKKPQ